MDSVSSNASMRWFMRPIDPSEHILLFDPQSHPPRKPMLSPDEVTRFNDWLGERTLGEVVYQHLSVLAKVIEETEPVLV